MFTGNRTGADGLIARLRLGLLGALLWLGSASVGAAPPPPLAQQINEIEAVYGNEPPETVKRLRPLEAQARAEGGDSLRIFLAAWGYAHGAMDQITVADAATAELIQMGERDGNVGALASAYGLRGNMLQLSGRLNAAYDWVAASLPLADKSRDESLRYWLYMSAGDLGLLTGHLREGMAAFEEADRSAQAQNNPRRRAQARVALAPLHLVLGDVALARADARQAYQLAEQAGVLPLRVAAKVIESQVEGEAGQTAARERALEDARQLARQLQPALAAQAELINPATGGPLWYSTQAEVVQQICDLYLSVRNFAAARRYGEQALALARQEGDAEAQEFARISLGMARLGSGEAAEGRRDIDAGLAAIEARGKKVRLLEQLNRHADLLEHLGDAAGAIKQSRRALALETELVRADRLNTVLDLQRSSSQERHEHALEALRQENELQASRLARNDSERRLTLGLIGALLSVVVLTVAFLHRVRKANLALKGHNAELAYVSLHDRVTGLPNRRSLEQDARELAPQGFTGLGIHINRLGLILGSLGHVLGDELVCQVAGRLRPIIEHHGGRLYRLDGLSFGVILPSAPEGEALRAVLDELLAAVQVVFLVRRQELSLTLSIGAARYPEHGRQTTEVAKAIQLALSEAQKLPGNSAVTFTDDLMQVQQERLRIETLLTQALAKGELELYYQAQCSLDGRRLTGFEALLRWRSPDGMIPPDRFIPIAEESGLMVPIGRWVLRQACLQAKAWQDAGCGELVMAINVSPRQFQHPDFMHTVREALKLSGIDPRCIELEITEGAMMDDAEGTVARMAELKELGLHLAIDDFGTGYSSLAYLKRFPLDRLKIDRSFVHDLVAGSEDSAIVQALIQLAHSLGMTVVAEGVEDLRQEDCLRDWGCDLMQGFGYARPLPVAEATALLQAAIAPAAAD